MEMPSRMEELKDVLSYICSLFSLSTKQSNGDNARLVAQLVVM